MDPGQRAAGEGGLRAATSGDERGGGGGGDGAGAMIVSDQRFAPYEEMAVPAFRAATFGAQNKGPPGYGRTTLAPLALFAPRLITDDAGQVSADFVLPDSVTRYRITAVATDGPKSLR